MPEHLTSEIRPFHTRLFRVVIGDIKRTEQRLAICDRQGDMIDTNPPPCSVRLLPLPCDMSVCHLLFVYLRMSISGALYAPPFLLTCLIFYERIIFFLVFTISIKSIYLMKIKSIFFQVIINGNLRGIIPKHAAIFFI